MSEAVTKRDDRTDWESGQAGREIVVCEPMHPDEDGWSEWIHPLPRYLMQCCDCDLIHEMEFAIVPRDESNIGPLNDGEGESVIIFRAKRHEPSQPQSQ